MLFTIEVPLIISPGSQQDLGTTSPVLESCENMPGLYWDQSEKESTPQQPY